MRESFKRFSRDTNGNVGLIFGFTIIPLVVASGAALDYSGASNLRSNYQAAADAAALAGAKVRMDAKNKKLAETEALLVFRGNLQSTGIAEPPKPKITILNDGVRVEGEATRKTWMMKVVGITSMTFRYSAEAVEAASQATGTQVGDEIALVLDNTGSMENDMAGLRSSATAFVDSVMNGQNKVSLVPFVTAVNVGRHLQQSHLDRYGQSEFHGTFIREIGPPYTRNNSPIWSRATAVAIGGCNYSSGTGWNGNSPGSGGRGAWILPSQKQLDDMLHTIFGINTAHAQSTTSTPNTVPPLRGRMVSTGPRALSPGQALLPDGFTLGYESCHLDAPHKVNHFDLISRIPDARWKGCVEARTEPFDVTDAAPNSATPNSLFVPYFWPDEDDPYPGGPAVANNYMRDDIYPQGWGNGGNRIANIFKYNGTNRATIVETPPNTSGPNKACPSEMRRLTNDKGALKNAINDMRHWHGGGTILVEGLAWGWRSLSPSAPLADGKPYSKDNKKTIIFMSDGDNELGDARGFSNYSHYSSYGYLSAGRFPQMNFASAHSYLDERFLLACDNAKAAGITIITVLFRNRQGNSVSLMRRCASKPSDFYYADGAESLAKIFGKLGTELGGTNQRLRLTK